MGKFLKPAKLNRVKIEDCKFKGGNLKAAKIQKQQN